MLEILMIIYQWILVLADTIHMIFMTTWSCLRSVTSLVIPAPMKVVGGQTVLVTGAGHGIGRELALQLSRLGMEVVCLDINEESNRKTAEDIRAEAGEAHAYTCDVSNREVVKETVKQVRRDVGEVDMLINNAGIMHVKSLMKHSPAEIERTFAVNVLAHFHMVQECLPHFMASGRGHIVAVASIVSNMGVRNLVPYSASKFAVKGMMEALKEELRYDNQYPGIKLTCVMPFVVDTGLVPNLRVRFPRLNPVLDTATAAARIIEGIRREDFIVQIPASDFYIHKFVSLLPLDVQHVLKDFMDVHCEPADPEHALRPRQLQNGQSGGPPSLEDK